MLGFLIFGIGYCISLDKSILEGELWTISTKYWFWLAMLTPIIHQIYVLICWRLELYGHHLSKTIGRYAFPLYKFGFALLILMRPVSLTLLAVSNMNTLMLPPWISLTIAMICFVPSVYLFYSVKKYFGMDRAFGIDHFDSEKYKNEPPVTQGIFKYTSNGMYVYGFLILWIPGLLLLSKAALLLALFNHLYIWVHYYCTEQPDMKVIYGS